MCARHSSNLSKTPKRASNYKQVAKKPRTIAIAALDIVPCLFVIVLAAPVKVALAPVFVFEGVSPVVLDGVAPSVLPGVAPPDGVVPSVPPDGAPPDGVTFSGACAARAVKLSMVRDLFCAGLS